MGWLWDTIAVGPMVNSLIVLSKFLFSNFALAIIVLTIVVNLAMYPLTKRQISSTKAMQDMQPKLAEMQKKYARDKQKLAQEQMRLYKEAGINPAGCLVPMLIQMPIWLALYQSINRLLGDAPEALIDLARFLYPWQALHTAIPLGSHFLWMNLALPDGTMIMPILVGASMWVQQKMVTPSSADPRQQQQSQMMLWVMPIMFGYFALLFPSGLALFWFASTLIRIIMQYFMTGWGALLPRRAQVVAGGTGDKSSAAPAAPLLPAGAGEAPKKEDKKANEAFGDKRSDRGRGGGKGPRGTRRKP